MRQILCAIRPTRKANGGWAAARKPCPATTPGAPCALDPRTGELVGSLNTTPPWAGTLSTAGNLVFAGDLDGHLMAFDARTGKELWHKQTHRDLGLADDLRGRRQAVRRDPGGQRPFRLRAS
ncbi:MAG: PQQ-binding-like beta-propeller repeat protein [Pyrinomonadaceae bacterium]